MDVLSFWHSWMCFHGFDKDIQIEFHVPFPEKRILILEPSFINFISCLNE